jgi:hypothetical protein
MNLVRRLGRFALLLSVLTMVFGLASCATPVKPEDVPANLSPAKFFQVVQEMIDKEDYDNAQVYLDEFAKRNAGSQEAAVTDRLLEGEYLSAQISYKKGKLAEARDQYAALLKKYDGVPEKSSSPPQWIRVLCAKMVDIISKKLPAPTEGPNLPPNP